MEDTSPCAWHVSLPVEESWFDLLKTFGSNLLMPLIALFVCYFVMCLAHSYLDPIVSALSTHLDAMSNLGIGVWNGLKLAHPWALELLHQAKKDSPFVGWLLPFCLLGVIHWFWHEPPQRRDHWWKHRHRMSRQKRRHHDRVMRRWMKPRFKGASIKDKNFSRRYPLRLRTERRFWTRAPTHEERNGWTDVFGDLREWFHRGEQTTAAPPPKGDRTQGSWHSRNKGATNRGRSNTRQQPKKAPPFRVQRSNRGFEACFRHTRAKQSSNTATQCWVCGDSGHIARHCKQEPVPTKKTKQCWTCGNAGHHAQQCEFKPRHRPEIKHTRQKCTDHCGRSTCRYPNWCPFAKEKSSHMDRGREHECSRHWSAGDPESSFMPTQEELDRVASVAADPPEHRTQKADEVMAFCVAMDPNFINAALCAPHKVKGAMPADSSFKLIWDSGASHCITNNKQDFIGPIRSAGFLKTLTGLARGLVIRGVGTVAWTVLDVNGKPRTLKLEAYLVPKSPVRLLSTAQLLQTYSGETISLDDQSATLSGIAGDPLRAPVKAFVNPSNNIPDCAAFQLDELEQAALALNTMVTSVDPRNINLTEPQKELLRWHQRLGHLDFKKIQFLMRSGALSWSASKRSLHTQAAKITHPPQCAACQFGKQTTRSVKGHPNKGTAVVDRTPVLKEDKLFPGQMISVDHFVCTTKGVTPSSRGGANAPGYTGGCIMVDLASGLVHVEFQQHLNTHETLKGLQLFETWCMDHGVVPTNYISDSGTAFTSKAFMKRLETYKQIITFVGTSAHHHNAVAERSIRTIMSIARTMMIHAASHWPEMAADATLWPLAVKYAVYIFNRVPNRETGLSALDVFTSTRQPTRQLHDLHVFGSPAYLLDKTIADGKKLPRWKPRSERVIFVGISDKHFAQCPMVLNPRTRAITTPYHVVFDDWFATVGSSVDDIPDFQSPEWQQLFGDSTYQFVPPEPLEFDNEAFDSMIAQKVAARRAQVGDAMASNPSLASNPSMNPHTGFDSSTPSTAAEERENKWLKHRQRQAQTRPPTTQIPFTPKPAAPATPTSVAPEFPTESPTTTVKAEPTHIEVAEEVEVPTVPPSSMPTPTSTPRQSRMIRELADHNSLSQTVPDQPLGPRRSRRQPNRLIDGNLASMNGPMAFAASKSDPDTFTLEQALSQTENYDKWIEALEKEIRALEEHGVWEEVPISEARGDCIPTMVWLKIPLHLVIMPG